MPNNATDERPGLAIIHNSITPYHVNLERLIAAGIPELKLHVLISHWVADFKWQVDIPPELHLTRFGREGEHPLENPLRHPVWGWRKGGRMIQHLRNNRVRAVIINGYRFISYARVMDYCSRQNIPFFVNSDSNIRNEPQLNLVKKFGKRAIYAWWMKRVSGVFSFGTLGDRFFMKYGADPQRLYRVPCWPEYGVFEQVDANSLARFRQRFGLDGHRRRFVYSGRLVPEKRVDLLIDAFAAIASDRPQWDLLIMGDGVMRDELQRRVPEALQKRVVWTGFLDRGEPALAYHSADVLVLPSDHEPWALVVPESMAAGLVVVSSDVPGASYELVEDGRSGRIFPAGNLEDLKRALLEVTADNALPRFKAESQARLARYRQQVDPVAEVRRALTGVGVLNH
jgi:glycosyltransferase involved in cell wall biosynthesis